MLKAIQLENIRRHLNTRIELGQLTVIAGANGVGKSTVLIALERALGVLRNGPGEKQPVYLTSSGEQNGTVRIDGDRGVPWRARLRRTTSGESTAYFMGSTQITWPLTEPNARMMRHLPRVASLHLVAEQMRTAASLTRGDSLHPSGWNIGPVIARLTQLRDGRLEAIETDLRAIVPGLVRVFTQTEEVHELDRFVLGARLEFEFEGVGRVRAQDVSSGTLLVLGLLTALRLDNIGLVLIDDAEQGLHMAAQELLMDALRAVLRARPELQVVLTTHSPFIMNGASTDEIVLLGLEPSNSGIVAGRIHDYPDADALLKHLSPAELWTSVHEGWMTKPTGA